MSIDNQEITINLDTKRLIAIGILTIISLYTLYTYSIALLAFVAPTSTPSVGVTTFNTYTTGNVQVDTFTRGTTGRIKATFEKATAYNSPSYSVISDPETVKVSIAVYYDDSGVVKILKFYTTTMTLTPGVPQNLNVDFSIPSSGVTGANYYANVFVWDDYLPSGGTTQIDTTNSAGTVPQKVFSAT